jgi:hypothetical protein
MSIEIQWSTIRTTDVPKVQILKKQHKMYLNYAWKIFKNEYKTNLDFCTLKRTHCVVGEIQ